MTSLILKWSFPKLMVQVNYFVTSERVAASILQASISYCI